MEIVAEILQSDLSVNNSKQFCLATGRTKCGWHRDIVQWHLFHWQCHFR